MSASIAVRVPVWTLIEASWKGEAIRLAAITRLVHSVAGQCVPIYRNVDLANTMAADPLLPGNQVWRIDTLHELRYILTNAEFSGVHHVGIDLATDPARPGDTFTIRDFLAAMQPAE